MKKHIFVVALVTLFLNLQAQTEVKINTLGTIIINPSVSAEFAATENIGIEPYLGLTRFGLTIDNKKYKTRGPNYGVLGKYYISPEGGIDKFYVGLAFRGGNSKYTFTTDSTSAKEAFTRQKLGVDVCLGYKWVSENNVVFEISAGLGRKISNKFTVVDRTVNVNNIPFLNFDGFIKFNVGYRFGGGGSRKN